MAQYTKETTVKLTDIHWSQTSEICDQINTPIPKNGDETATASMWLIRLERDFDGVLSIDRRTFLEIFDNFGYDPYWLSMILSSTYGFFSRLKEGGTQYTYYIHTVSYTMLWTYNPHETTTKAVLIPREHSRYPEQIFKSFIQTVVHHKDLVSDSRFCSFVCAVEVVRWIEGTAFENLGRIRSIEVDTGHGAWHEVQHDSPPSTDELMEDSKRLGFVLTALANVSRHACIVRAILNDLASAQPLSSNRPALAQSSNTTSVPSPFDDILVAASMLEGQTQSGELQAGYLQERARTQQAVIFNLLTREDAKSSKEIALAARKDSYSMKTIAIMTMIFLPPTFFATLFAMPLLKWDGPKVVQPNFGIYWAVSLPTTVAVLLIWHWMSSEKTIFARRWTWIKRGRHESDENVDLEKARNDLEMFRWNGLRYRSKQ
ncbi:hypothetical protein BKA58DRAFT_436196 [Alternaria rosae]|uniref:uncharacterized protein n=1 Tax=Alternaria rosae TaxID=1187941 RepID=UPI001E8E954D|nr:uncharacterized protein BKA58DRAFT_436196 [Alternaria rosae]KAH6878499.1 hypothetical protein BKA58DRAFT_436196 [Alternaria rosae]